MRTILDEARTWFLRGLVYDEVLKIVVIEGSIGTNAEDLKIGDTVLRDVHPIQTTETSKHFLIQFSQFVAWQVLDESFSNFDEYEIRDDDSFLCILERSKYLDYVNANHGWYIDMFGSAKHYRVWTENEVIDVVSCKEPTIELVKVN